MMKFSRKTEGVISVFLILILVPTMVFSALLVDGSRMVSARAITQEAADLAALSVLSGYNSELKNEFGLFALEDASNAKAVFEASLSATLQAAGLGDESYSEQVWGILKDAVGSGNPYKNKTFMNLYDFKLDETSVTPMYTLANPEVLQNQIVEYSKYRGLYVLSERLGLLNHLSDLKSKAEELDEAAEVMDEKMGIDAENAAADKAILEVEALRKEVAGMLGAIPAKQSTFFTDLGSRMAVLAGIDDLAEETKKEAEGYDDARKDAQNHFTQLASKASELDGKLPGTKQKIQNAIESLNGYINDHSGSGNETVQGLIQDARNAVSDYQKCLEDIEALETDENFRTLVDLDIGMQMAGVVGNIDTAISKYGDEGDPEDEEDTYKFYYYESDGRTEDIGDAIGDYRRAWDENLVIDVSAPLPELHASVDYFAEDIPESQKKNLEDDAKAQSGSEKSKEQESGGELKSLGNGIFNALPSKTFSQQAEIATYRGALEEDLRRTVSGGEGVTYTNDPMPDVSLDFYDDTESLTVSRSILQGNKNSSMFSVGDVLEGARDEVLTLSYIFGIFKTRLTGDEKFKKGALDESKKDKFYIVPWRYLYDDGEQDMQFSAKSKRKTALNAQIEYLIYGMSTDAGNEAAAYASIYAPRMANNMLALYQNTSVKSTCDGAAALASVATLGTVPPTVFFWIFLTAWTVAETILDMHYLIEEGYKIPFFKTKDTVLLEYDFSGEGLVDNYRRTGGGDVNFYVSYEDYLLLFLLLKSSDQRLMRVADLVEMDMKQSASGFEIENAYTYIRAKSDLSIRYLFLNTSPLSEEYQNAELSGRMKFKNVIYQGY